MWKTAFKKFTWSTAEYFVTYVFEDIIHCFPKICNGCVRFFHKNQCWKYTVLQFKKMKMRNYRNNGSRVNQLSREECFPGWPEKYIGLIA